MINGLIVCQEMQYSMAYLSKYHLVKSHFLIQFSNELKQAVEKYELTSIQRHNEIKGNGDEALVL